VISVNYTPLLFLVLPIPYSVDKAPPLRRAPVTVSLVVVNIALFALTHFGPDGYNDPENLYAQYGLTPASVHVLQFVTYTFLHINVAHVLWNMLFLYLFGAAVELRLGSALFAALYVLAGAAAGLLHCGLVMHFAANASPSYEPLVGASGAISGVLGLFVVFGSGRKLNLFWPIGAIVGRGWDLLEIPCGIALTIWLIQTIYGCIGTAFAWDGSGIAYFAHLGGFVFGSGCGLIGGLRSIPDADIAGPRANRSARAASVADSPNDAAHIRQSTGVEQLLERAVDAGDYDRAASLYAKCLAIGADVSGETVERMSTLAARSGHEEQAAAILARSRRGREGS
jgi:hypothetical protein